MCVLFLFLVEYNTFLCPVIEWQEHIVLPCSVIPSIRHSVIPLSSVSVHYLCNSCTHLTQIWLMNMSYENTGQVWIWLWLNDFWQSYAPFTLKIKLNVQFPFIISQTVLRIQLKFDIWVCQMNAQVKFEFGHGLNSAVMSFSLWK
jgi:hypothetical protein